MKYAQMIKIPPELQDEPSLITSTLRSGMKIGYYKGLLYRYPHSIKFGETGEDFIRNLITVLIEQYVFRAPRIVKKHITKGGNKFQTR